MSESSSNKQECDSLCNLDFLLVNLGRNRVTAERLIRLYLENYPVLSGRLTNAANARDLAALRDALHDIRSSCVLFSGQQCVDLARNFESALRNDPSAEAPEQWAQQARSLCECMHNMAEELRAYLSTPGEQT